MKRIILIFTCFFVFFTVIEAQSFQDAYESTREIQPYNNLNGTNSYNNLTGNPNEWSKAMGIFYEFDDIRFNKLGIDGSAYLFDQWNQQAVVQIGEKRFVFSNINYHIKEDVFITKIENDSIFVFDFQTYNKIEVGDRIFKSIYNTKLGSKKIYEVLYEDEVFMFLKSYSVSFVESSPNPMVNRPKPRIKKTEDYYISREGKFEEVKLRKSIIKKIFPDYFEQIDDYMEKNKLSYKNELDFVRALKNIEN